MLQLIREDNKDANTSYFFTYDNAGNLTEKYWYYLCSFEDGTAAFEGMPKQSFAYDYANKTYTGNVRDWNDTLKVVGGHPITYDNNGNPLRYRNSQYVFTWTAGRQLATATHGGKSMSYTYDESGLRQSKTVDGVKTTYTWNGDKITSQSDGTNRFYFFYDGDKVSAFEYNGSMYSYVRNLQGDVVGIVDSNNNVVAEYAYDAWGNLVKILDGSGNNVDVNANHIANLNPIRYRGYYYDIELQMYYLQSRYYDPVVSRFINADDPEILEVAEGSVLGANLFAYCENNPVIDTDPTGNISLKSALSKVGDFLGKVVNSFVSYLKRLVIYNKAKGIIKISTTLIATAIDALIATVINRFIYKGIKWAMKQLL